MKLQILVIQGLVMIAMALGFAMGAWWQSGTDSALQGGKLIEADRLRVREIEIINSDNQLCGHLYASSNKSGILRLISPDLPKEHYTKEGFAKFLDEEGKIFAGKKIAIGKESTFKGKGIAFSTPGKVGEDMVIDNEVNPIISFRNTGGLDSVSKQFWVPRLAIQLNEKGDPEISLTDKDKNKRIAIGSSETENKGGDITIYSESTILAFDKEGNVIWRNK